MSNIIDFKNAQEKKILKTELKSQKQSETAAEVISISSISSKKQNLQLDVEDRRQNKRTVLTDFISVHVVVPRVGLVKAVLYDINEKGISFDLEQRLGHFNPSEEVALRLYLNHNTYFPMITQVKHITAVDEELVYRHGSEFVSNSVNALALHHLIRFLETVNLSLVIDRGDLLGTKQNS